MTREMPNKLERSVDGAFELLDRQILDVDGRMLGKVDDIELTQTDEGLTITALLTGQVALLHRLGGSLGNQMVTKYIQMRPAETNRSRPWRITMEAVERLDSAVHLRVHRDESLHRDIETFRLGALTGMNVLDPDGQHIGRVLDARFELSATGRLTLHGLVVGRGHPGALLGYDRYPNMGPTLVRWMVAWLHRHTQVVTTDHVRILWNKEQCHIDARLPEVGASPLRT